MTIQQMLELLEIEHECMLRGSHGDCDRNCANCELVQDDGDLHEMYTDVIAMLKEQEAVPVVQREVMHMLVWCCGSCGVAITKGDKFCRMCGRKVKWNDSDNDN